MNECIVAQAWAPIVHDICMMLAFVGIAWAIAYVLKDW